MSSHQQFGSCFQGACPGSGQKAHRSPNWARLSGKNEPCRPWREEIGYAFLVLRYCSSQRLGQWTPKPYLFFSWIIFNEKKTVIWERSMAILGTLSCFTYREVSKYGCIDTESSRWKFDPGSLDLCLGCDQRKLVDVACQYVLVDASQWAERNVAARITENLLNEKLSSF